MKNISVLLLVLALACTVITGCGAKEKAGEKIAEKILEQGGVEDVDIDGDKITVKVEDGQKVTVGGSEWPDSELVKNIPEFKHGKIAGIVETSDYLVITFEEVSEADAVAYIEKNKADFTLDNFESKSESMISWSGKKDNGLQLSLTFTDSSFSIMVLMESSE